MREKAALKLIPYGNSGFRSICCDGFAYADKTRFIETLERSGDRFMLIVRPRRFGKTLFTETLHAYYDKSQALLFEKSFNGTYIGSHRTPLASEFYVLKFIFAGLSRENPEGSFLQCVRSALVNFFNYCPHPREQAILGATFRSAAALIEAFFAILGPDFCQKVFVIIDEYDHLANAVLSRALNVNSKTVYRTVSLRHF